MDLLDGFYGLAEGVWVRWRGDVKKLCWSRLARNLKAKVMDMGFSDIPEKTTPRIRYADKLTDAWLNGVCHSLNPNLWITFNYNRPTTVERAQGLIRRWHDFSDRKLVGRKCAELRNLRTAGVIVFEHLQTNLHGHGAIRSAIHKGPRSSEAIFDVYRSIWKKVVPSGELDIRHASYETRAQMFDYMKKESRRFDFFNDILVL